ncbi:hypothetical protein LTR91_023403 [Friedmanniomyces endolithicus]|uniref:Uncharacterized protein n=1 Tax=Friedmanniomyces endolithicus TaxID=329885 RepID=A0AAN6H6C2_9PEZI|nr:hypothetical protein LTR94_020110 [Friedmanniomyces endolithicus]KAK0769686.1 hypothetical protein LTR59_016888 [Friedmanniomyces endolithicus]KAK0785927.1 hypothetical protein LTR75_013358 [Friedmanniomyces endolithicus]KAK0809589.1 hypothetical protein LTR38_004284 [Friedmanniomyces endolithicus]KAK0852639.1 hypothetical protein LTR03_003352 [Friedmanniomyces endolithicus]
MDIPLTVLPWYRDRGDHRETDGQNKELKKVLKLLTQVNRESRSIKRPTIRRSPWLYPAEGDSINTMLKWIRATRAGTAAALIAP